MFAAILIMCGGILFGRLLAPFVSQKFLSSLILIAVAAMLFLLGAEIGASRALLAQGSRIIILALILTAFFLAGSIVAQMILARIGLVKITKSDERQP